MLIKTYLVSMLLTFQSVDLNKCSNNRDSTKITVLGRAIIIKNQAAVRTDDSLLYYLDGVGYWDEKYLGKRVKVTGKPMPFPAPVLKSPYPGINVTPQPRLRDGKLLGKAKWRLVK